MNKTDKKLEIPVGKLGLSAQVALLGVIGLQILGICIQMKQSSIEMIVFSEGVLSDDEKEEFDIAATNMMGNFSPIIPVDVRFVENASSPLKKCSGRWVFLRYGCLIKS